MNKVTVALTRVNTRAMNRICALSCANSRHCRNSYRMSNCKIAMGKDSKSNWMTPRYLFNPSICSSVRANMLSMKPRNFILITKYPRFPARIMAKLVQTAMSLEAISMKMK